MSNADTVITTKLYARGPILKRKKLKKLKERQEDTAKQIPEGKETGAQEEVQDLEMDPRIKDNLKKAKWSRKVL